MPVKEVSNTFIFQKLIKLSIPAAKRIIADASFIILKKI